MDTTAAMAQPVSASNGPRHASLLKQEPDPDQRVMAESGARVLKSPLHPRSHCVLCPTPPLVLALSDSRRVKLAMERIVAAEAEVEQARTCFRAFCSRLCSLRP